MNTVDICITGESAKPFPVLGHGLWVNQLEASAETQGLIDYLGGAHLELLVDLREPDSLGQLHRALDMCQRSRADAWLLVVVGESAAEAQLRALALMLKSAACRPQGILATPSAYLESYQPDGTWPDGPTPDDIAALVAECLPGYLIGGGVATYFTELNRCRPSANRFDYLTHATSPVVHAADDLSVMESLESLVDITRSARQLAHGKPYRLTTTAIGAWRNPYGGQLTPNPRRERLTLSNQDPRQRGLFAAAWTLGHYAALRNADVDAVALWAVNQPFAVAEAGQFWPVFHVLRGLNQSRGSIAMNVTTSSKHIAALAWQDGEGIRLWMANLTADAYVINLCGMLIDGMICLEADTYDRALNDPDFLDSGFYPPDPLPVLAPYGVMVLNCQCNVESGI